MPASTDPPGELMYRKMSLSLSSDSRCRSWATTRLAIVSSTASPRKTMRSLRSREKMSNERSPRADVSITIGTRAIETFLFTRELRGCRASLARGPGAKEGRSGLLDLDRHVHVRGVDRAHDRVGAALLKGVLLRAGLALAEAEVRGSVRDGDVVPLLALPDPRH